MVTHSVPPVIITTSAGLGGFAFLIVRHSLISTLPALGLAGFAMSWERRSRRGSWTPLMQTIRASDSDSCARSTSCVVIGNTLVGTLADTASWDVPFGLLGGTFLITLLILADNRLLEPC